MGLTETSQACRKKCGLLAYTECHKRANGDPEAIRKNCTKKAETPTATPAATAPATTTTPQGLSEEERQYFDAFGKR